MANIYTDAGVGFTIDALDTGASTYFVGHGSGATTAAKADTTLEGETNTRVAAVLTQPDASTLRWSATIATGSAVNINNAGPLSASVAGVLILHSDFATINLATDDAIAYTFDLTIS